MKSAFAFIVFFVVFNIRADYLVYDSTVWAQSVINCNSQLAAMEKSRVILASILSQAENANTTLNKLSEKATTANTALDTISKRLGDPDNMVVNLETTSSADLSLNREMADFREKANSGSSKTNGENELYGEKSSQLIKYQASEWAYDNFERVMTGNLAAKKSLLTKRDAIIAALEKTNAIAEVEKLNASLVAINGKLDTIHKQEVNALMKLMAQQIRNDQQEKKMEKNAVENCFSRISNVDFSGVLDFDFSRWKFDSN